MKQIVSVLATGVLLLTSLFMASPSALAQGAPSDARPISIYSLDNRSTEDSVPNPDLKTPAGTLHGDPQPTEDRFGNVGGALLFDGVDDWVETNEGSNTLPLTFSVWFRADDIADEHSIVDSDQAGAYGHSLLIGYDDPASVNDTPRDGSLDVQYHNGFWDTGLQIQPGVWYQAFVTYGDEMRLYLGTQDVSMQLIAQQTYVPQGDLDGTNFRFGRHNEFDAQWFKGAIDDIRFYDRELTPEEIDEVTAPPTLDACNDQATFIQFGDPVPVSPNLTLNGNNVIEEVTVYVEDGSHFDDILAINGAESGSQSGISWARDTETGILKLSGTATAADYQAVLRQLTYENINDVPPPGGTRIIKISIGNSLHYAGTDHFYEFVSDPGISWSAAKAAAEAKNLFGQQGYLVTVTSQGENDFVISKLRGRGWMAASDQDENKVWRWVSGPEAGTVFFYQKGYIQGGDYTCGMGAATTQPPGGHYTNWGTNEPNDWSYGQGRDGCAFNEDVGHFWGPDDGNLAGSWNDFPANSNNVAGYVVEYGGMPGDPKVALACSATVNVIKPTTNKVICAQQALVDLLNSDSATIELDGNCNYVLDGGPTLNNHNIELFGRTDKVINGNGATISQGTTAATQQMLFLANGSNITMNDVTFSGAKNGALRVQNVTNLALNGVTFDGNQSTGNGGAVTVTGPGSLAISNSHFLNNRGKRGGAIYAATPLTVRNSLFADNIAEESGAAIHSDNSATMLNNTIVAAQPNTQSAIYVWGQMNVANNIIADHATGLAMGKVTGTIQTNLYANNKSDTKAFFAAESTVTLLGESVSTSALNLVNPAGGDYRLKNNSPAIDRGTAGVGPTTDADGNARPFTGTSVDIGAYEYQGEGVAAITIEKHGPPWFQAGNEIRFVLIVANPSVFSATNLAVRETLPAGTTYVPDSVTDGGQHANGVLTWTLAELKPGEDVRLEYKVTANNSFTSDNYEAVSQVDAAVRAVGTAHSTTLNTNLMANLGFFPDPDGYRFHNYSDSPDSDFTVDDMVFAFGADAVCKATAPSCVLTAAAEQYRKNGLEGVKGGHCAGMATSSLEIFANPAITPEQYQSGAETAFALSKANIRKRIALYAINQWLTPVDHAALTTQGNERDIVGNVKVLNTLIDNLANSGAAKRYTLYFYKPDMTGGHVVTPYAVEKRSESEYWIYVYDNNYPNDFDRVIKVTTNGALADTTTTASWIYEDGATIPGAPQSDYTGTGTGRNQLVVANLVWTQSFPKVCGFCSTPSVSGASLAEGDLYEFSINGEGFILVTRNTDGKRIGYDWTIGELVNEISGAEVLPFSTGLGLNTADRLQIPHTAGATYTIQLASGPTEFGNFVSTVDLTISGAGKVFRLTDLDLNNADGSQDAAPTNGNDVVSVQFAPDTNRVNFKAGTLDGDAPDVIMAIDNRAGEDFTFEVKGADLAAGNALAVSFDAATQRFSFEDNNASTASAYNITVSRINQDGSTDTVAINDATGGEGAGGLIDLQDWDGSSTPTVEQLDEQTKIFLPVIAR